MGYWLQVKGKSVPKWNGLKNNFCSKCMSSLSSNAPYSDVDSLSLESLREAESLSPTNSLLSSYLMTTIKAVLTEYYVAPFSWVGGRPPTLILWQIRRPETFLSSLFPDGNTQSQANVWTHTHKCHLTYCTKAIGFSKNVSHHLHFKEIAAYFNLGFGLRNTTSDIVLQTSTEMLWFSPQIWHNLHLHHHNCGECDGALLMASLFKRGS